MKTDIKRAIIERDECFAIQFPNSELIFEFEDSNERADQYQNAVNYLIKLTEENQIDENLDWVKK